MEGSRSVGQSWINFLNSYSPYKHKVEQISASVLDSCRNNKLPIIGVDQNSLVPVLINSLSDYLDKQMVGLFAKWGDLTSSISTQEVYQIFDTKRLRFSFRIGEDWLDFKSKLEKLEFKRVKKVWNQGEYSVLGDVIIVWPHGFDKLLRFELWGDVLERIHLIDRKSRRSVKTLDQVRISSNTELLNNLFKQGHFNADDLYVSGIEMTESLEFPLIFTSTFLFEDDFELPFEQINLDFSPITGVVDETIFRNNNDKFILVVNHNLENVREIKEKYSNISVFQEDFPEGFSSKSLRLKVLTDKELWGTVKISRRRSGDKYEELIINEINKGDYVVHEDHGVGVYSGLVEKKVEESDVEFLEIKYAQDDTLSVPIDQISRVTKFVGVEGSAPKLTRLGGGHWLRIKRRVKKSVEKLAAELLRLYAAREISESDQIPIDTEEILEFEKDFEYKETEDQIRAIEDVKRDLSGDAPMDRLLVGDVGFGKTEVAMRAAFIIIQEGMQAAVLAPTTVLVEQHYHVFKRRMSKFGVNVAALSRFLGNDEIENVIKDLKSGKVDLVIGTHRLLSKDVKFKDLGLIVIDEEQRFGVSQKEKLKKARVDANVLSLSATPIPRTLNMALSGVRDISVIATPPEGRKPIKNFVKKFEWDLAAEAIKKEVNRGGQVYFVHNRVNTIGFVKQRLEELLPDVRFVVGHGQMSPQRLSKVMREFHENTHHVLICTTIIENGLDLPNVNTLIVDRAEMFGLAQLYQLRGRIGRGDRQAFAYFLYHGAGYHRVVKESAKEAEDKVEYEAKDEIWGKKTKGLLWDKARRRLDAIRDLEDLGSGFGLAKKDLEIRGAGNFLGREQHGNVAAVGFSLYCKLLQGTIERMKRNGGKLVTESN